VDAQERLQSWAHEVSELGEAKVGRGSLTLSEPAPMVSALETINHELLSTFAYGFNLRRYT